MTFGDCAVGDCVIEACIVGECVAGTGGVVVFGVCSEHIGGS